MKRKYWLILSILLALVIFSRLQNQDILGIGQFISSNKVDLDNQFTDSPIEGRPQVQISTSKGDFVMELRPDLAPKSVAHFLGLFAQGLCNNLTFHRVEDWVVQGCDPTGDGTGGELTLTTETSPESFTAGSIGIARRTTPKNLSNDRQFFIVKADSQFLDGEYTYIGRIVSGMDVVNRISIGDQILETDVLTK